jgi:hypothetical protein
VIHESLVIADWRLLIEGGIERLPISDRQATTDNQSLITDR